MLPAVSDGSAALRRRCGALLGARSTAHVERAFFHASRPRKSVGFYSRARVFKAAKPQPPIQARVSAAPAPLGRRVARKTRGSKLKRQGQNSGHRERHRTCRAHDTARAQSRAAHRSEQRLPSSARPTHVVSCPQRNSQAGEGLPRAPRPPSKTRSTLTELASRSLNTARRPSPRGDHPSVETPATRTRPA